MISESTHIVRNRQVLVGDIRKIIADLPDDAPVEIIFEGDSRVATPSGASCASTVYCRDGLQFFVRKED